MAKEDCDLCRVRADIGPGGPQLVEPYHGLNVSGSYGPEPVEADGKNIYLESLRRCVWGINRYPDRVCAGILIFLRARKNNAAKST